MNAHLERLGFALIPRSEYMTTLMQSIETSDPTREVVDGRRISHE
jgi:Leu/Phe-tRNA-protein transferase